MRNFISIDEFVSQWSNEANKHPKKSRAFYGVLDCAREACSYDFSYYLPLLKRLGV